MSDKSFRRLFAAVVVLGILTSAALVAYTVHLHENVSIIAFIANESR